MKWNSAIYVGLGYTVCRLEVSIGNGSLILDSWESRENMGMGVVYTRYSLETGMEMENVTYLYGLSRD